MEATSAPTPPEGWPGVTYTEIADHYSFAPPRCGEHPLGPPPDWPAPVAELGRSAKFDPTQVHALVSSTTPTRSPPRSEPRLHRHRSSRGHRPYGGHYSLRASGGDPWLWALLAEVRRCSPRERRCWWAGRRPRSRSVPGGPCPRCPEGSGARAGGGPMCPGPRGSWYRAAAPPRSPTPGPPLGPDAPAEHRAAAGRRRRSPVARPRAGAGDGGLRSTSSSESCSCVAVGTVKATASRWYQGLDRYGPTRASAEGVRVTRGGVRCAVPPTTRSGVRLRGRGWGRGRGPGRRRGR